MVGIISQNNPGGAIYLEIFLGHYLTGEAIETDQQKRQVRGNHTFYDQSYKTLIDKVHHRIVQC